jgi:putative pyruvate formate lyase activating enzyme
MIERAPLRFDAEDGGDDTDARMLGGVIVRHLFLPGGFADTAGVLRCLKEIADDKAFVSLMTQYTPVTRNNVCENRRVSPQEAAKLRALAERCEFSTLFFQELDADSAASGDDWLPDFSRVQPFSNALAKPVWHWTCGPVR